MILLSFWSRGSVSDELQLREKDLLRQKMTQITYMYLIFTSMEVKNYPAVSPMKPVKNQMCYVTWIPSSSRFFFQLNVKRSLKIIQNVIREALDKMTKQIWSNSIRFQELKTNNQHENSFQNILDTLSFTFPIPISISDVVHLRRFFSGIRRLPQLRAPSHDIPRAASSHVRSLHHCVPHPEKNVRSQELNVVPTLLERLLWYQCLNAANSIHVGATSSWLLPGTSDIVRCQHCSSVLLWHQLLCR